MRVNTGALYTVVADAVRGKFFRYIRTRYAADPLSMHVPSKMVAGVWFSALLLRLSWRVQAVREFHRRRR